MNYYGYMEDNNYYFFLLEFINGMDLFDAMHLIGKSFILYYFE